VIARGAAFAFRKNVEDLAQRRLYGAAFASSSVVTPFFLGTVAGAIASGRVPPGIARRDVLGSWLNPTSLLAGVLAVGICGYLAAVYLCADAIRAGQHDLADAFRRRALGTGLVIGAVALAGIAVLHADAPRLFAGVTGRGLPVVALSAVAGLASLGLLVGRRYQLVRIYRGVGRDRRAVGVGGGPVPAAARTDAQHRRRSRRRGDPAGHAHHHRGGGRCAPGALAGVVVLAVPAAPHRQQTIRDRRLKARRHRQHRRHGECHDLEAADGHSVALGLPGVPAATTSSMDKPRCCAAARYSLTSRRGSTTTARRETSSATR